MISYGKRNAPFSDRSESGIGMNEFGDSSMVPAPDRAGPLARIWRNALTYLVKMRSGKSRRSLATISAWLESQNQDLDKTAADIAAHFLEMGNDLKKLTTLSDTLLAKSTALSDTSGLSSPERLNHILESLRTNLDFVEQCQADISIIIQRFEVFFESAKKLRDCEAMLNQTLMPLQTSVILLKIHSTALSLEDREFFMTLSEGITKLQEDTRVQFQHVFQELLADCQRLGSSIPALRQRSMRQSEHVKVERVRLERALDSLQEEWGKIHANNNSIQKSSQKTSQAISTAVIALQYQDITRQRWEHVAEGLRDLHRLQEQSSAPGSAALDTRSLTIIRMGAKLQSKQIEGICTDLEKAQKDTRSGISQMMEQVQLMSAKYQEDSGSSEGQSTITVIADTLDKAIVEIGAWVKDCAEAATTLDEAVRSFDKTTSNIAETLRNVSWEILLVATNALVQAAKVAENTGLDTISEHISNVAVEVKAFSELYGAQFDRLIADLNEMVQRCGELHGNIRTREEEIRLSSQGQQNEIRVWRNHTQEAQAEISAVLAEMREQATQSLSTLDFDAKSEESFARLRNALDECVRFTDLRIPTGASYEPATKVYLDFSDRYTMDSERLVFEKIFNRKCRASASAVPTRNKPQFAMNSTVHAAKVPAAPAETEALGDNVDLF